MRRSVGIAIGVVVTSLVSGCSASHRQADVQVRSSDPTASASSTHDPDHDGDVDVRVERSLSCFGAAALPDHCGRTIRGPLSPVPSRAVTDRSDAYQRIGPAGANCFAYQPDWTMRTCVYGDPRWKTNVAFVGNSHAGQWLPAVQGAARRHHWKVTTYLVSRCVFTETLQVFGGQGCLGWTKSVEEQLLAGHFSLIVLLNSLNVRAVGATFDGRFPLYEKGYEAVLRKLAAIHARVVGVRDNPIPHVDIPACLAAHPSDYAACSGLRSRWVNPEPLFTAMNRIDDPRFVKADLTNYFCGRVRCDAAVGGVTVYLDRTHPTATFAATLAPYLDPFLVRALKTS